MADDGECCGWSAWGALAGMRDAPAVVDAWWEGGGTKEAAVVGAGSGEPSQARLLEGRAALVFLAAVRGRLRARRMHVGTGNDTFTESR